MNFVNNVLVEYEDVLNNEIFTSSGILFANKFVIITPNVLVPYLKTNINKIKEVLTDNDPGKLNFTSFSKFSPQLNLVIKNDNYKNKYKKATVIASFICKNILNTCSRYLHDWAIDVDDKDYQIKEFLSLFFILKICNNDGDSGNDNELNKALEELLIDAHKWPVEIGRDIFIESTPFGNRQFINSYSQGVISNVVGENACLLLSDCPSAPGSEGCPVFIKTRSRLSKHCVGIVISCLNWWKGEWTGLTLCANLVPLLSQLVPFTSPYALTVNYENEDEINSELLAACSNSLVQVVCGFAWGTGILIDKQKGIFLTNSHVTENDQTIFLHWNTHRIRARLIYKTPNSDVYDIAVLQANMDTTEICCNMLQVKLSLEPVIVGELVYAAGFPLFGSHLNTKVTLTKGYISQANACMIRTTCTVLPGSSGGSIFTASGHLIAVIVSNTRMDDVKVVYPRVNTNIPIGAIYTSVWDFLRNDGVDVLKKLHSQDLEVCKQWNNLSAKL